jgi:hypothetical protein
MPNPSNGEFYVRGLLSTTDDQEVSLEITNMLGQVVYTGRSVALGGKLNEHVTLGKTLINGMYTLSVRTVNENKVFHIVIEQ